MKYINNAEYAFALWTECNIKKAFSEGYKIGYEHFSYKCEILRYKLFLSTLLNYCLVLLIVSIFILSPN